MELGSFQDINILENLSCIMQEKELYCNYKCKNKRVLIMRIDIVPIGNSKGIRLSKTILEQCGFQETVEAEVVDHQLVIKASHRVRQGWDKAFSAKTPFQENHFEEIQSLSNKFDKEEWEW